VVKKFILSFTISI